LIEEEHGIYSLSKDATTLVFRTTSFRADKGSVLHSGIYNREFSSVLASFASAGLAYFSLVRSFGKEPFFYPVFLFLFIVTFPLFRKFVFRERFLETVFDRSGAKATISLSWIRKNILESLPLTKITGIRIDTKKTEVVNRDGVEFVEKISAMHGTVIPGFGEETVFYSLKLRLADGTDRTIFADRDMRVVLSVHDEMKEFLNLDRDREDV
jgi:hypothetical protein